MEDKIIAKMQSMSKINFNGNELPQARKSISFLLEKLDDMEQINTDGTEPTISVRRLTNVFREDKAVKSVDRETLLENTEHQYNGCFTVPKIID